MKKLFVSLALIALIGISVFNIEAGHIAEVVYWDLAGSAHKPAPSASPDSFILTGVMADTSEMVDAFAWMAEGVWHSTIDSFSYFVDYAAIGFTHTTDNAEISLQMQLSTDGTNWVAFPQGSLSIGDGTRYQVEAMPLTKWVRFIATGVGETAGDWVDLDDSVSVHLWITKNW